MRAQWLLLTAVLLSALAPQGCVSLSRGGLYPLDRDSVFVGFFANDTFYRDVEFKLTERVVAEILSRPGLHLTSKEEAEVLIEGRIVHVRQAVLSEDPDRTPTFRSTSIAIEIQLRDAFSGEVYKTVNLTQAGDFVPNLSENVDSARLDVFRLLARDVVRALEAEF